MANMNYALFGATGTVGKALAAKLAKRGRRFRVVGRSEDRLRHDFGLYEPLVEYCAADLGDSGAAARAAAGVDTIFYTWEFLTLSLNSTRNSQESLSGPRRQLACATMST